jgi:hypothetical protein
MKPLFCSLILLALGLPALAVEPVTEAVAAIGILPDQRTGLAIEASERNPFAVKPKAIVKAEAEDTETQESKIRALFRQINVTGVRRDRQGRSIALAGDLILREGEAVQPVLSDQTEVLIVSKVEAQKIELTFVEDKDSTQPRVIVMPVRNQVQVTQRLFGQPKGKGGFYVARGKQAPELEETAAALAATPPTAPASARPADTAAGGPTTTLAITPRDSQRDAAALAGLSDHTLANAARSPSPAPPSPATTAPTPAPVPQAAAPATTPDLETAPPPTINRRRTEPPTTETAPAPLTDGVVE